MKQYRLEMDWNGYLKGYVFEDENGWGKRKDGGAIFTPEVVDLLLKSKALSLVEEVELPEKLSFETPWTNRDANEDRRKINEILDYLKANKK